MERKDKIYFQAQQEVLPRRTSKGSDKKSERAWKPGGGNREHTLHDIISHYDRSHEQAVVHHAPGSRTLHAVSHLKTKEAVLAPEGSEDQKQREWVGNSYL